MRDGTMGMARSKTPMADPWFATTAMATRRNVPFMRLDFPSGQPARRVTLHITVPKGLKRPPSNGKLLGVDTLPDGRTTWN